MLELEVNEGREIDSASWVGVVEMLLCSCCESLEGIGVRREEDDSYLGVDEWFQALHSIIPTLASFEDVGGLLLMKFLSKCVFWVYFASILRVFEHFIFIISYDERSFGSRGSVVDAESDYIDCILCCIWMQYCWWKLWDFWIWNESILALLCLSSPLANASEDNCW